MKRFLSRTTLMACALLALGSPVLPSQSIAVGGDESVYALVGCEDKVIRFDGAGRVLCTWSAASQWACAQALAIDDRGHVYVGIGEAVREYSSKGDLLGSRELRLPGEPLGLMADYLSFDSDGIMYAYSSEQPVVWRFKRNARRASPILLGERKGGQDQFVRGIGIDRAGSVYAGCVGSVIKLNRSGKHQVAWQVESFGYQVDTMVEGFTVSRNGDGYVLTDSAVTVLSSAGTILRQVKLPQPQPNVEGALESSIAADSIAVSPSGYIYVRGRLGSGEDCIWRFTNSGRMLARWTIPGHQ